MPVALPVVVVEERARPHVPRVPVVEHEEGDERQVPGRARVEVRQAPRRLPVWEWTRGSSVPGAH